MLKNFLQIKHKVSDLLHTASQHEPFITEDLKEIVVQANAKLVGLENRFKTENSLFRKLNDRIQIHADLSLNLENILKDAADSINDVLRYTMIFEVESYSFNCQKTLKILEQRNCKIVKVWNAWLTSDTPRDFGYRGINLTVVSPRRQIFELQFHTAESYTAKEANHFLYEQMRLAATGKKIRKHLRQEQIENAAKLKFPPNVKEIK